jgi:hypothetical protein
MTIVLASVACIVAVAAAARSTWSPCGLSMLATITPLAEQGRGHRYRTTATWFLGGSVLGGASLGALMAVLAVAVGALGASVTQLGLVAIGGGTLTLAAEVGVGGFRLPVHHRQVNERWLDQFRPWVYGAGFGWQIGSGLATYIKTYAVYLMIVLAALTVNPTLALLVGIVFGLVRGLAVLLGRRITSTDALANFHRRFMDADPYALAAVVGCEAAATLALSIAVSPWLAVAVAAVLGPCVVLWSRRLREGTAPIAKARVTVR